MINSSYNPDVLSCLANLSSDEVFTPPELANKVLDLLPPEVWGNPNLKFLDPFTKSGVFLREITKRLSEGLKTQIPDIQQRIDHILKNQVFGIATSELTSLVSRRSLYCSKFADSEYSITSVFDSHEGNIFYERGEHEWNKGRCVYCNASLENPVFSRTDELENLAYPFLHEIMKGFLETNYFDVIVGGPPYHLQDSENNVGASAIYPLFVEKVKELNPRFMSLIIPARWFAGGKGLDEFRKRMLQDKSIMKLVDYPITSDVFPGLKVIGGICFFLRDSKHNGPCQVTTNMNGVSSTAIRELNEHDTFVRFNQALPIIRKVLGMQTDMLDKVVSQQKPFGLRTNYTGSDAGEILVYRRNGTTKASDKEIKVNRDLIDKWKVVTPMGYGEGGETRGYPRRIIGSPFVIEPGAVCTETYIVVKSFETENEATLCVEYLKTKFVRFLIGMRKNTQHVSSDRFKFVPDLKMDTLFTDDLLDEKYDLSNEEREFIDSLILTIE